MRILLKGKIMDKLVDFLSKDTIGSLLQGGRYLCTIHASNVNHPNRDYGTAENVEVLSTTKGPKYIAIFFPYAQQNSRHLRLNKQNEDSVPVTFSSNRRAKKNPRTGYIEIDFEWNDEKYHCELWNIRKI